MKTLVIIPSRLAATRLPGKPLLKINGLSIISHVVKRAEEANIGEVCVAAGDKEIVDEVKKNGGQAILTDINHKTGTDRIYEAINKIKNKDIELVMNLQGDEPLMNIQDIQNLNNHMILTKRDLGTLAAKINNKKVLLNVSGNFNNLKSDSYELFSDNGKIVVALIDEHEAMLKRIRKKGKVVALESANRNYETKIFGPDRVKVQGVLVSLYRNF